MTTAILRPDAVGDLSQLYAHPAGVDSGEHWDKVNDVSPDDASSYVYMTPGVDVGVYKRDLYTLPTHEGSGTIEKITVYFRTTVNVGGNKASIRTHGTTYDGSVHGITSWTTYSEEWATNPNTGNPWTWDEIDALEAGVSLSGISSSYWNRCTQVYVVVAFSGGTETLRPNGEGSETAIHAQLTGKHWERVDEETADDDATYVHRYGGSTGFADDSYNLSDLGPNVVISNVEVVARVRRIAQNPGGTYPTSIGLGVRVDGSSHFSNTDISSNSYGAITRNYATNPDTGVAWTPSEIDNLQAFLRLRFINMALWQGGLISGRCTQIYVVVTYEPAIVAPTVTTDPATEVT